MPQSYDLHLSAIVQADLEDGIEPIPNGRGSIDGFRLPNAAKAMPIAGFMLVEDPDPRTTVRDLEPIFDDDEAGERERAIIGFRLPDGTEVSAAEGFEMAQRLPRWSELFVSSQEMAELGVEVTEYWDNSAFCEREE